jgi:hypothetical protein
MQESRRESIPEAWIGQRVTLEGPPHVHGILRDINEFGIAYEIVYESPHIGRIIFVPWHRIDVIHLDWERLG